ncbi:hypothetical protein K438DRAFT_1492080, partial [Mycena galopus ATCC 62051]
GAFLIGVLISYMLLGVTSIQVYIYYNRFPDDSRILKSLVSKVTWRITNPDHGCIDCVWDALYTYTISDYGQPKLVVGSPLPQSLSVAVLFAGFSTASHGFFAFRIFAFPRKVYIASILWFMAVVLLLGRIILSVICLRVTSYAIILVRWEWLLTTIWALSAATDWAITIALVTMLLTQRPQARTKTVALLDKLILWTIG